MIARWVFGPQKSAGPSEAPKPGCETAAAVIFKPEQNRSSVPLSTASCAPIRRPPWLPWTNRIAPAGVVLSGCA